MGCCILHPPSSDLCDDLFFEELSFSLSLVEDTLILVYKLDDVVISLVVLFFLCFQLGVVVYQLFETHILLGLLLFDYGLGYHSLYECLPVSFLFLSNL
jgi:hypothetical protein